MTVIVTEKVIFIVILLSGFMCVEIKKWTSSSMIFLTKTIMKMAAFLVTDTATDTLLLQRQINWHTECRIRHTGHRVIQYLVCYRN